MLPDAHALVTIAGGAFILPSFDSQILTADGSCFDSQLLGPGRSQAAEYSVNTVSWACDNCLASGQRQCNHVKQLQ